MDRAGKTGGKSGLLENFEYLPVIFDTLSEGVALNEIIYDEKGIMVDYRILLVNKAYYSIADVSCPDVIGRMATEVYGMTAEFITQFWYNHRTKSETAFTEMLSPLKNRWFLIYTSPFHDDRFVTSFVDITERKKSEQELAESENRFRIFFENAVDAVFIAETETGILTDANPAAVRLMKMPVGEIRGLHFSALHPANEAELTRQNFRVHLDTGASGSERIPAIETKIVRSDGSKVPVEVMATTLLVGGRSYLMGTFRDISDRKKAEKDIRDANQNLQRAQRMAHIGSWEDYLPTGALSWSDEMYRIMGFEPGKPITLADAVSVFPPEELEKFTHAVNEALDQGIPYSQDYRIVLPGGLERYIHDEGEITCGPDGKPTWMFGTTQDITERINTLKSLQDSERRLLMAQLASGTGVWDWDMVTGQLIWTNELFLLFGLDPHTSAATFETWDRVFLPEDRDAAYRKLNEAIEKRIPLRNEYRIVYPDGTIRWILALGKTDYDHDGKPLRMYGICMDTTDDKQAEHRLKLSESTARALINATDELAILVDPDGRIHDINDFGKATLDPYGRGLIGQNIFRVVPEDSLKKRQAILREAITASFPTRFEDEREGRHYFTRIHPILDASGNLLRSALYVTDITERKESEMALKIAIDRAEENNRLKSAFLANMSHEIRTPMNAIMGFSELMMEAEGDDKNRFAGIVVKSADHLLSLIDDIIFISRLQSERIRVNPSPFRPAELVEEVVEVMNLPDLRRGLTLTTGVPPLERDLMILSDREKIRQILTNLTSNALKFSRKGIVNVGFECREDAIEFFVTDDGIGVPPEEQDQIFHPFYRGRQALSNAIGGTGLGLSICTMLAELLKGAMGVTSVPGRGSRFYLSIPLVKIIGEQYDMMPGKPAAEITFKPAILIAEDEPDNYYYLELLLSRMAGRIAHAQNGREAIEILRASPFDLVLMDLKMPEMDGFEATEKIRELFPEIPVIAQTAYATTAEHDQAMNAGCADYLVKPIRKKDLYDALSRLLIKKADESTSVSLI